jgi:pyridoxine/pyridoxamine 5'-phosphate oxidase
MNRGQKTGPTEQRRQRLRQMARYSKKHQQSDADYGEAMRIARGSQRPGQTKEQTRLIAQGIRKGIEQYKKQQSAKARELDKKLKKANERLVPAETGEGEVQVKVVYRQHWLPWLLLVLSWLLIAGYWFVY